MAIDCNADKGKGIEGISRSRNAIMAEREYWTYVLDE
jgi:hypothetical protein